jgi:hypothetical protein
MSMKLVVAMTLIALMVPAFAQARLDCIVPTREEGFDPKQPGAAELQCAARAVAAIVQQNEVFMQGNKPVRVRTTINYGGWNRQSASVVMNQWPHSWASMRISDPSAASRNCWKRRMSLFFSLGGSQVAELRANRIVVR